ncbi:hypothetical protein [Actinorugispora endophytica]|uniref:Mce-associated membrane protein n=1 Tax=Actinorugispora endophytica TaxID=1605990 RepID=A0A4R6VDM8_9ACTN|nr:hypothetical protein [Actinorugispora endophytica]TDQ55107.1 hypothetical protein EV190_101430 [Actinorugispora endophytica]
MRTARALGALVGCGTVLVLLAGCADDSGPQAVAVPETSATETATAAEDAVLAAYNDMWATVVDASHAGDTAPPDLERYATGGALELMHQALAGVGAEGGQMSGEPVLDPVVTEVEQGVARITDCVDDSGWSAAGTAGQGGAGRLVEAGVSHDGLVWRVSELRIWEPGTC